MKTLPKFLMFGCMALALAFTSCSNDDEPLAIGDFHEGGVIFYLDGTGQHGLVCALSDQSTEAEWGCYGTAINGADGTAIGAGSQNTIDIESGCTEAGTASKLCVNLTLNSYSDWFLPSKDELHVMFIHNATINATATANGGTAFAYGYYWSSTEHESPNGFLAWTEHFSDNPHDQHIKYKWVTFPVRAVRAF